MPNNTDKSLYKLAQWALTAIFGVSILVASWFLGGLYERLEKIDDRVDTLETSEKVLDERVKNLKQAQIKQWQKLSNLETQAGKLEGALLRIEGTSR